MMKKGACTGRVGTLEKVLVEKIGDRVTVTGAYTKAELRELLLSQISLIGDGAEDEESKKRLDSTLKKTGMKQADFDMLREDKDKVSKEGLRTLKDLKISDEMISKAVMSGKEKRGEKGARDAEKLGEKAMPRKRFSELLRAKGLSESLIKELRANGLTDEYMRLLRALGFTDEEIEELMKSLQAERDMLGPSESSDSCVSVPSSSDEYLSPESLYLKSYFRRALSDALREIVMKKPFDPVEYLGHWLLNYKICEERNAKRREMDLELRIERERLKIRDVEDIDVPEERGEEEGFAEDWNYIYYGEL